MADYYSILKKTIASLPESNGAARRSVYSRARNAIVNQLKAYEPPLSPSEITAEQLRLEEAIRKVEAEAARESLGLTPASVAASPRVETPAPQPAAPVDEVPSPEAAEHPEQAEPAVEEYAEPVATEPQPGEQSPPEPHSEPHGAVEEDVPSPLKETLSEAEALGAAATQAVQTVKEVVEPSTGHSTPAPEPRQEPIFENKSPDDAGLFAEEAGGNAPDEKPLYSDEPEATPAPKGRSRRERPSASDALRSKSSSGRFLPIALGVLFLVVLLGAGAYFLLPLDDLVSVNRQQTETGESQSTGAGRTEDAPVASSSGTTSDDPESSKNTDRLLDSGGDDVIAPDARTVTTTTITPQSTGLEPVPSAPAIVTNPQIEPVPEAPVQPQSGVVSPSATGDDAPLAVPQDNLAAIAPEQAAPEEPSAGLAASDGVQRSILYEEGEDTGGEGTASQGAVVWGLEEETNLDGQRQSVLTASIDIPERDVKVDIRIKPNDDTSLPASHLVEIKYDFPESFAAGDVVNVPGLVMKPTEEARGDALIGASVKVQPGFFWIALSNLPNEQQRNLNLLRERGWIDIPMLYENGKRGILTLEKGPDGAVAVEKAVTDWQAG